LSRAAQITKYAWLALVFGGVVLYIVQNSAVLVDTVSVIPVANLLACLVTLTLGRFLLVYVQRMSIESFGYPMPQREMVYVYAVSQMARYLPGGLWHFVGLTGFYHARGVPVKTAGRAVLVEYLWLVLGGGFMGLIFSALIYADAALLGAVIFIAAWFALTVLLNRQAVPRPPEPHLLILLQVVVWVVIGASVWLLMPDLYTLDHLVLAIGAFAVSWTLGFVTVFAPGGVGIREPALVLLLASVLAPEHALIYVTVHRLCYVAADLILFFGVRLSMDEPALLTVVRAGSHEGD
jgi:hypothetical protein